MRLSLHLLFIVAVLGTLAIAKPGDFGSIINHVFSCDCFIGQIPESPLDELLKLTKPQKMGMDQPFRKHPKLVVIHPPRDRNGYYNKPREIIEDSIPNTQKQAWDPFASFDSILDLLQKSQRKLNSWIQSDNGKSESAYDPTKYTHQDEYEETLFSLEKGAITRNIVRLGRFLQLFDKFDCRCAGNLTSILNAEQFVRFTVAHV